MGCGHVSGRSPCDKSNDIIFIEIGSMSETELTQFGFMAEKASVLND